MEYPRHSGSNEPSSISIQLPQFKTLVGILTALATCSRPDVPSVRAVAASLSPFDSLESVHLGMTVRELSRSRPAKPLEYVGLIEHFAKTSVTYLFQRGNGGFGTLDGRLAVVSARRDFERSEPAETFALETFDTLVRRIGQPVSCELTVPDRMRSIRARWKRLKEVLELVSVQSVPGHADALGSSFWVVTSVRDDTTSVAFNFPATAVALSDCAAAFRSR